MPTEQYLHTALLLLVSAAAINDLATRRIPNRLLLAALAGALVLRLLAAAPVAALLDALAGGAIGLGLFLPFYLLRGMAAGDVKLMATVGVFAGPQHVLAIAALAWCAGGALALGVVLWRGRLGLALRNIGAMARGLLAPGIPPAAPTQDNSAGAIPYGVAIAAGTIALLLHHYA
jgi:prepilin peptidase CpaA